MLLTIIAFGVKAQDVTLGDVSINLPPPPGFCGLVNREPSDARALVNLGAILARSGNRLLSMAAECQQLTDWRAGRRQLLDDYSQYQTPIGLIDKPLSTAPEFIKRSCASIRAEGQKTLADRLPSIRSNVEEAFKQIKINETRLVGVLAEDSTACYAALIQKISTEVGTDKTQVIVFAITAVKDKLVYMYRFAPYRSPDTVGEVLPQLTSSVAALLAANRN